MRPTCLRRVVVLTVLPVLTAVLLPLPHAPGQPPAELRKLHALLVIDTRSGLGESVVIDGERMGHLLQRGMPRAKLELTVLTGKDVTAARILNYYRNLKADANDALFFYYAGHGAIDPAKGHFLALQELDTKPLLRSDLRKAMQDKNPGLQVLLTDCCSSRFKLPDKKRKVFEEVGEAKELDPVLRCLFLRHRGVVDVTAASDNTAAFGDDHEGGVFTRTLGALLTSRVADLDVNGDKFVSWNEVFPRLQKDTEQVFARWARDHRARGEKVEQTTQKPRALELPDAGAAANTLTLINEGAGPLRYQHRWSGDTAWENAVIAVKAANTHQAPPGKSPALVLEVKFDNGEAAALKLGKSYRWTDSAKKKRGLDDPDAPPDKK